MHPGFRGRRRARRSRVRWRGPLQFRVRHPVDRALNAPTPNTASRLRREATIAKLLKRHGIRHFDAASVVNTLRRPPVRVAAGTVEAASAHVALLVPRRSALNRRIKDAHSRIDGLTARLMPAEAAEPGQKKQHDAEILASLPGVGRTVLATLLAEASDALQRRDYAALRSLAGSRAGHQEVRKELRRRPTTGRPRPPRQRRLPLGPCRRSARSAQPRQIRHLFHLTKRRITNV